MTTAEVAVVERRIVFGRDEAVAVSSGLRLVLLLLMMLSGERRKMFVRDG